MPLESFIFLGFALPQMESLEENFLDQFKMTKRINEQVEVRNLEYSVSGDLLSYTTDESLKIYSAATGCLKSIITVKIGVMKYFQRNTVLHTKDNAIYYLSVHDNKYLRRFEGHSDKVLSLSTNPFEDLFMSIGGRVVSIWDIRYRNPVCEISFQGELGALSEGHEYALADNNFVYIFDRRNDEHPIMIKSIKPNFYRSMWYTGDGSCMVLSSKREHVFLDSSGDFVDSCASEGGNGDTVNESNTLLYGSSKSVLAYKILDKRKTGRLDVDKECKAIKSNPSRPQFVFSTSDGLRIWNIATEQVL